MDPRDHGSGFEERLRERIHQRIHDRMAGKTNRPRLMLYGDVHWGLAWGLALVLGGGAILLYHMGVIPFNPVTKFWPALLILFGVMNLLTRSGRFFGFLLILVGTLLQLNALGYTRLRLADMWPIALIALGLLLMWGSLQTRGFAQARKGFVDQIREQVANATDTPPGVLNAVAIFGGCERRVNSKNFAGGKATAVFGGVELDFRDADIASENGEAIIEINCVFGGVEIRVPESWHVQSRNVPVFGGYEDTSRQPNDLPGAKPKTLIITGMVVFGGVEIRN